MKKLLLFFLCFAALNAKPQNITNQIDSLFNYCQYQFNFNGVVLAAQKNHIIYERAFGKANVEWNVNHTMESKFRLGSLSKQFTAFIILQLCLQGKLSLNDNIHQYVRGFADAGKPQITIQNLLTHTSGLADYTNLKNFNERLLYPADSIIKMIQQAPAVFSPSKRFGYCNSNYFLLAQIAERITGKTFETLLNDTILHLAGMKDSGEAYNDVLLDKMAYAYLIDGRGIVNAPWLEMKNTKGGGSMYSTAGDLFKWSVFFQGELSKNKFLKSAIQPYHLSGGEQTIYSSGWCLFPNLLLHTGHINGFANIMAIDTSQQQTIIVLTNSDYKQLLVTLFCMRDIIQENAHALNWMGHNALTNIAEYAGTYAIGDFAVEIKSEDPDLAVYFPGGKEILRSFIKDEFFFINREHLIKFNRDKSDRIVSLSSFQDYEWTELKKIK